VIEYRVLGPLRVKRDGKDVAINAPKVRSLLLALLLRPNEVVSADQLLDALWGERAPGSARKLVQIYVSQLRAALGADEIETLGQGYRIRVTPIMFDAVRFERMREDGARALDSGNAELGLALARRALGLWRGPALVDVAYEPFASAEAARLDELRLTCIEDELDADLALGRHDEVVPELQRFCAEHPRRERARERLALALYRCSRQSEALDVLAEGRRLLLEELGLEPGKGHQQLERAILTQDPALDAAVADPGSAHLLPSPSSALIGRGEELDKLRSLVMRDDVRIVTVSGAGGSGKTRVALELARSAGASFANGAVFVELASVQDPKLVLGTIGQALGVPETPEETPAAALARWLQSRDMLLVADNFEHILEAAPELGRLVQAAPRLTVLVTSRRVLHISGEHVFPLSPLPVDDAVRLFSERAAAHGSSVPEDPETSGIIAAICRRVDCLPLALELAAARTTTLTPQLLLERLSDRVTALGIGPRDAPARQQTLTDTLRWSTDLLSAEERGTLASLSVFVGGSSIGAAEAVCDTDLERLAALVDSSLLQRTAAGGAVRLSLLETIREHAAGLLDGVGNRPATEARHAAHFAEIIEVIADKGPASYAQELPMIHADLDNMRTAIERSELAGDDDTALRIATGLYRYYYFKGSFREGRERISGPLERGAGDPVLQALALRAVSGLHFMLGDFDPAASCARRGIDVGTAAGAGSAVLGCHTVLAHIAREKGQYAAARRHLEESETIAKQLGRAEDVIVANTNLGELALALGNPEEARRRWQHSINFYGEDDENATFAMLGLGAVAAQEGALDEAAGHFSRAEELSERAGWLHNTTLALVGLAGIASERGEHSKAALLLGRVTALLEATGGELAGTDEEIFERVGAATLIHLGEGPLAELITEGVRASRH